MVGRTGSVVQYYEVKATYTAVFISLYFYFCLYSYFVYRSSGPLLPFPHIQLIFMSLYFICLYSFLYTDRECRSTSSHSIFLFLYILLFLYSYFEYKSIKSLPPPLFTYILYLYLLYYFVERSRGLLFPPSS